MENKAHVQRNVMQVFGGHVTSHRSWNGSSKMWERGSRDGDKLLCNIFPIKHEAQEREREMKCFTRTCPTKNTATGKAAWRSKTDISNTLYM